MWEGGRGSCKVYTVYTSQNAFQYFLHYGFSCQFVRDELFVFVLFKITNRPLFYEATNTKTINLFSCSSLNSFFILFFSGTLPHLPKTYETTKDMHTYVLSIANGFYPWVCIWERKKEFWSKFEYRRRRKKKKVQREQRREFMMNHHIKTKFVLVSCCPFFSSHISVPPSFICSFFSHLILLLKILCMLHSITNSPF